VSGAIAQEQTQPSTDMPATSHLGRWTTIIDALDTGQDSHKTCAASTAFLDGNGNAGTLTLSISTGDALPPDAYPAIMIIGRQQGRCRRARRSRPPSATPASRFRPPSIPTMPSAAARAGRSTIRPRPASLCCVHAPGHLARCVFGKQAVASIPMDGFTKAYRNLGTSAASRPGRRALTHLAALAIFLAPRYL
jgi:hypothetical protein